MLFPLQYVVFSNTADDVSFYLKMQGSLAAQ